MTELEEAREYFKNDRFAVPTTGIKIVEVGDRYAKCSLKIDDRHLNALGKVMGAVYFTMADFTFAVASNFKQSPTVTLTSQITYLRPAKGNTLTSESRLIKDGRQTCNYEITITDSEGNLVAVVTTIGHHV